LPEPDIIRNNAEHNKPRNEYGCPRGDALYERGECTVEQDKLGNGKKQKKPILLYRETVDIIKFFSAKGYIKNQE
jgi:hypothetical protein